MSKIEVMNTEFGTIKNAAGFNNFVLSTKQRILQTDAFVNCCLQNIV